MSHSPRRQAIKAARLQRRQAEKFIATTGYVFRFAALKGGYRWPPRDEDVTIVEHARAMAVAWRFRSVAPLTRATGRLESVEVRFRRHPQRDHAVECQACGSTVWSSHAIAGPTAAAERHARERHRITHQPEMRFDEKAADGFLVIAVRQSDHGAYIAAEAALRNRPEPTR